MEFSQAEKRIHMKPGKTFELQPGSVFVQSFGTADCLAIQKLTRTHTFGPTRATSVLKFAPYTAFSRFDVAN
jgi:hypothetical protein